MYDYLADYHMHSLYSTDGHDPIAALCENAIVQGLREIAVTDHFEPTRGDKDYRAYEAAHYFREIEEIRHRYKGKLRVKTGIELGQPQHYPESSGKIVAAHPFDYVLGSAHKMNDDVDFSELSYTKRELPAHCLRYLSELRQLAEWNGFDCIGHLDLVKRYAALDNQKAQLMDYKDILAQVLKTIIQNGKGIEVNTSGLRQAAKACLPDFDIIRFYKQLGGEIITVGSDAHRANDVGKGVSEAIEIIKAAGFNYLTVYSERKPTRIKLASPSSVFSFKHKSA